MLRLIQSIKQFFERLISCIIDFLFNQQTAEDTKTTEDAKKATEDAKKQQKKHKKNNKKKHKYN